MVQAVVLIACLGMANASLADGVSYSVVHGWPSLPEGCYLTALQVN
jgi:hypothetical protein